MNQKDFLWSEAGKSWLSDEYGQKNRSTYDLAEERGVYANLVLRALMHHGISRRTRAKAQHTALKVGRAKHPTKGTKRPEETRTAISDGMHRAWKEMSPKERERLARLHKQQWNEMSEARQEEMRQLAAEGVRRAASEGSQLELSLLTGLRLAGHEVMFHQEHFIVGEYMHLDMLVPAQRVAIEVDGPAHFFPIWGEESLQKCIAADTKKTGLMLTAGYHVMRIKHVVKNLSEYHKRKTLELVLDNLANLPSGGQPEVIEIELKEEN